MDWLQNKTTQFIALMGIIGTLAGFGYTGATYVNRIENLESKAQQAKETEQGVDEVINRIEALETSVEYINKTIDETILLKINNLESIRSDMSGMKAQISKQQASESNAPVTAKAAMAGATGSSSNPFSEDQEVRNALISLPSIMMENMNHLQTVNNTLEVKLTELSRNVA